MNKYRHHLFLLTICLGTMLNPLNSSLISVAIVRIQHSFAVEFATVSWLISVFYLCSAIAQPIMGKLGDLIGHKKIYLFGLVLFFIPTVLAPFVPNFWSLVVLRGVQAIGTSAVAPTGMALIRHHVTEGQFKFLGIVSIFSNSSSAIGPAIAGFVIYWLDWQGIFIINIPIILVCFAFGIWLLPGAGPNSSHSFPASHASLWKLLDIPGILLFTVSIILCLLFFTDPFKFNIAVGIIGLLALSAFIWREMKVKTPFIPLREIQRNRPLMWVILLNALINLVFYSIFLGFPTYLLSVRSYGEQLTGLLMLCFGGISIFASPAAGIWMNRSGFRPTLRLSAVLLIAGSLGICMLREETSLIGLSLLLSLLGVGAGMIGISMQSALLECAPREIIGMASGIYSTARFIGAISSSLLMGAVFGTILTTNRFRILGLILAVFSLLIVGLIRKIAPNPELGAEPDAPQKMSIR